MLVQQLRGQIPTNPPPPFRAAFQKQVTEGGAFKGVDKVHWETIPSITIGPPARDESSQERTIVFYWIIAVDIGQIDEINESDVLEYRRTTDLSSTDIDWLNSELHAPLAIKTSDTAMASVKSVEEVEVKGIVGWQRLEHEV